MSVYIQCLVWTIFSWNIALRANGDVIEFEKFVRPDGPWGRQPILLEDGGFSNILIAIHPDVQDSEFVIEQIRVIFNRASNLLLETRKQYFKEISILIPDKWEDKSEYEQTRPNQTLETARVIVRNESSLSEPAQFPFVRRYGGCGEGEYIYLPFNNITSENETKQADVVTKYWEVLLGHTTENCVHEERDSPRMEDQILTEGIPLFRLIQKRPELSVIILDAREHMQENNKFSRMMEKYEAYIWHLFPTYSWLGVVTMQDTVSVTPCFKIWADPSWRGRFNFKPITPQVAKGSSSLGDAVYAAIEVLKGNRDDISGSRIFIMSDGTDVNSTLDDVEESVIEAGVVLASLPYSHNVSENIVLNHTVNQNFTVTTRDKMIRLEDPSRYSRIFLSNVTEVRSDFPQLFNIPHYENQYSNQAFVLRIQCTNASALFIAGIAETGEVNGDDQLLEVVSSDRSLEYLEITSNVTQKISVEVFSAFLGPKVVTDEPFELNKRLQVRTILKSPIVNFTKSVEGVLLVAVLSINESPVTNVSLVEANVVLPNGVVKNVQLSADDTGNDGSYSGYFTDDLSLTEGEYSYMVHASSDEGGCLVKGLPGHETRCDPVPSFNQYTTVQKFVVLGIPPSPIIVTVFQIDERKSGLEWAAPGEDYMIGKAARYDVRFSPNPSVFEKDFVAASPVTATTSPLFGTVPSPQEAMAREYMEVSFSHKHSAAVFYVAIRAIDNSGNVADMSNVVKVVFDEIREETIVKNVSTSSGDTSFVDTVKGVLKQTPVIGAICVIGVLILGGVLYRVRKYSKNQRPSSNVLFMRPPPSKVTPLITRKFQPDVSFIMVEDF